MYIPPLIVFVTIALFRVLPGLAPEVVAAARQLKAAGKPLREISAELAKRGHLNNASKPYGAESIARMIRRDQTVARCRRLRLLQEH